jgi:alkylated DNA repair dioxygenase AlkB
MEQTGLFEEPYEEQYKVIPIPIEDGCLQLWHPFFEEDFAKEYFDRLQKELNWQQDYLKIAGKEIAIPRLQAWYGDADSSYSYSGLSMQPQPWNDLLKQIKAYIEETVGHPFNSVLANQYRNGQDSVAWHQDNEPELGQNPVIASLSLGDTRTFQLKHKRKKDKRMQLDLPHNSLLVMSGTLQHHWYHQVPKTTRTVSPRINLTFRLIRQ